MEKVALVTGASSGVGACIARQLANRGWKVYGTSRQERPEAEHGICWLRLDLTDETSIAELAAVLRRREGRLDALVHNAGMGLAGPMERFSSSDIAAQMAPNFTGVLLLTRALLPLMGKGSRILAISSLAASIPIPFQSLYSASKAALEAVMEALATELEPFGIRTCCLQLGDTHTAFTQNRRFVAGDDDPRYGSRIRRSVARMEHDEQNGMAPQKVAACAARLLEGRHYPLHKVCGLGNRALYALRKFLPRSLARRIVSHMYGGGR